MESDYKEPKPKLSFELDREEPSKNKKNLWLKIKKFFTQGPEGPDSQYWEDRDPSDW